MRREGKKKVLEEGAEGRKDGDEVSTTQRRRTERVGSAAHPADESSADRALSGAASEHDRAGVAAQRGALRRVVPSGAGAGTSGGTAEALPAQPAVWSGRTLGGGIVVARAMESRASERVSAPGGAGGDQSRNDLSARVAGSETWRNPAPASAWGAQALPQTLRALRQSRAPGLGNGRSRSGPPRWQGDAGLGTGRSTP